VHDVSLDCSDSNSERLRLGRCLRAGLAFVCIEVHTHHSIRYSTQEKTIELKLYCSSQPNHYHVGLTKSILLNIDVVNLGENAYDTQCSIQLPVGVEYVRSNSSSTVEIHRDRVSFSSHICSTSYLRSIYIAMQ
jgi:hypothetical protein